MNGEQTPPPTGAGSEDEGQLEEVTVTEQQVDETAPGKTSGAPDMTPEEEKGQLRDYDEQVKELRATWAAEVLRYVKYTTIFTMGVVALALVLDFILVIWQIESDPDQRLLNTQVLLALIAASVAQIGAVAYLIGKSFFR